MLNLPLTLPPRLTEHTIHWDSRELLENSLNHFQIEAESYFGAGREHGIKYWTTVERHSGGKSECGPHFSR